MTRARVLLALALGWAVVAGVSAPPAAAHGGDLLARPIFERIEPKVPGLKIDVTFSANYQFLVENPTSTELTILAKGGEPFIRIGPEGVFGNFKSKSWYESNVPEGLTRFPEGAEEGPDVEPVWRKVSAEPVWGWYDHRLHPQERYVSKEIQESTEPVKMGDWNVPIVYGDKKGEIQGRFEFKPVLGQFRSILKSPENPAEKVRVQVVSSRTIPAIFIENLACLDDPACPVVTVLGKEGEPFIRIGPKIEVNLHSPSWVELEQAKSQTPEMEADAEAEPAWKQVAVTPRWSWPELRAAPPDRDPPKELAERDSPTTVKNWRVPVLIGEEKTEIVGITQFVPIAQVRAEATAGRTTDDGGSSKLPLIVGAVAVALAAGVVVVRRPRKKPEDGTRHRSRSTPKARR